MVEWTRPQDVKISLFFNLYKLLNKDVRIKLILTFIENITPQKIFATLKTRHQLALVRVNFEQSTEPATIGTILTGAQFFPFSRIWVHQTLTITFQPFTECVNKNTK